MPAMSLDEDHKRRDSRRDDAHLGQPTFARAAARFLTDL